MNEGIQPKRLISYLFILAIAVVFTLQFGPGSRGCDAPLRPTVTASAAVVNGKEVSLREFQAAYNQQLQFYRMQGNSIPDSLARQLGIPRQVVDQLVSAELLAQTAEREGVAPSNDEIREIIHKNPDFQKDDQFDFQRYGDVVRDYYRKTIPEYESEIRRRIAASKLMALVESGASISDEEVKDRFFREQDKARLTFVRFTPTQFAAKVAPPTPADLAAFRKSHAKEIADDYQANRFIYEKPEQVRARHILIKVDKEASQAEKDRAKQRLEDIRKELLGGKNFDELAKQYSEDPGSKDKGGDLGFNERGAWVPEFADAAFSLKPGEVSAPVETQFGYHLIKVEEKKPATHQELKDVEEQIARQLLAKERSKQRAKSEAEKALAAAKGGKKLTDLYPSDKKASPSGPAAPADKPAAVDTDSFAVGAETIPQIGNAPQLAAEISALDKPQLLQKIYPVGEGFAVVQVTERTRPVESDFIAKKDSLREEALRAKQVELRESYLKALKKTASIVTNQELVGKPSELAF